MDEVIHITDDDGNLIGDLPQDRECKETERYLGDIIRYLSKRKPAKGAAKAPAHDAFGYCEPEIYKPRIIVTVKHIPDLDEPYDFETDIILQADYAYNSLVIHYHNDLGPRIGPYEVFIEHPTAVNGELGVSEFFEHFRSQNEVTAALQHNLKIIK